MLNFGDKKYNYNYIYNQTYYAYQRMIDILWSIENQEQMISFQNLADNFDNICQFYYEKLYFDFLHLKQAIKNKKRYNELVCCLVEDFAQEIKMKMEDMQNYFDTINKSPAQIVVRGFKSYE